MHADLIHAAAAPKLSSHGYSGSRPLRTPAGPEDGDSWAEPRGSGFEPLQGAAVDLDAQAGAVRNRDDAAHMLDRCAQDGLADRVLGAVELEDWVERGQGGWSVRRQHGHQLQRGGK